MEYSIIIIFTPKFPHCGTIKAFSILLHYTLTEVVKNLYFATEVTQAIPHNSVAPSIIIKIKTYIYSQMFYKLFSANQSGNTVVTRETITNEVCFIDNLFEP